MARLYHERGVRIFCFHDDTFLLPRPRDTIARLQALDAALRRAGVDGRIGMMGKCRPDGVDGELLRVARDCGVFRLYVGIENGSDAGLAHLGRRHDRQSCVRALELLREAGVFACFNILLFEPDCRLEDLAQTYAFLERFVDFPFNFCRAEVYSGSRYERELRQQGRLVGNLFGYSYEIHDPRAELAYRLMSVCFRHRNFSPSGVANLNTGMGYEAAVLRHFYGARGEPLAREVDALIETINRDTLQHLRRLLDFAASCDLGRTAAACDFAEELATTINFRDLALGEQQRRLRRRIQRFGNEPTADAPQPIERDADGAGALAT
jgi:anaerobic magnesium-protoporphyrin IX monomethyl ester cyclase